MTEGFDPARIANLRTGATALKTWMESVTEQQREAAFYGGYGVERAARDALDCVFRVASSVIGSLNEIADIFDPPASVDTLPKGQDAQQGLAGTEGSAVAAGETPKPPQEQPS